MKSIFHGRSGKIPPAEALTPISHQKQKAVARGAEENVDPEFSSLLPENSAMRTASAAVKPPLAPKIRSPLHPRPLPNPSDTPLKKKKLCLETVSEIGGPAASASESGVQVIVRMRPLNKEVEEDEQIVQKISTDSVSILDHTFTFDSVADTGSSQEDVFHLVGLPLVENCLAGFNSSIFAYGQTGSGKTYTMWGPSSATMEYGSSNDERGLTPRVFERLFSRIQEEQIKHSDKQLCYQCRCSFLEIYNEQIMDLLDPSQRNRQIREDVRTGVYVDCLSEEYVCSVKDVTRLLTKGLANRRTGATSVNSESSRSHCVFTCVVESHSKSIADGLTSLKISRINLVDLAGSERQKLTRAAGERLKEAGNINRSLSQLGNVINILAEISQTGKQRHIPYRDSKLTFLLQESLGGNAKLAMICAISPSQSCKNESFSTLRFAQRAKAIKNTAVINEISQDDVHALREQIRQLKDELLRMKANGSSPEANTNFSTGWNARRSLNLLRMSLGQRVDSTIDDDMDIDDDADIPNIASDVDNDATLISPQHVEVKESSSDDKNIDEREQVHEKDSPLSSDDSLSNSLNGPIDKKIMVLEDIDTNECKLQGRGQSLDMNPTVRLLSDSDAVCDLSIARCDKPPNSLSPKNPMETGMPLSKASSPSKANSKGKRAFDAPTEHLAASLQHGLQVITNRHQRLTVGRSLLSFPFKGLDFKPLMPIPKVDIGVQADVSEGNLEDSSTFICRYCRERFLLESRHSKNGNDHELQLVPSDIIENNKDNADGDRLQLVLSDVPDKEKELMIADESQPTNLLPKAVEKVLAGAIRREMALQEHCSKQNAEINQLRRLIQQYKHERECNAIIAQSREDKISRLENLVDGILPTEYFMEEEFISLTNEHKLLREKYDNHPEVLRANIELKKVQEELESYRNFYDLGERDVLMEEIDELRNQLECYITSSPFPSQKKASLLQLACIKDNIADQDFEEERRFWAETESKWLSHIEELELKLQESLSLAEKLEMELDSEKRCSDELKEALQTAMKGHARILDQYADLQEKHITMLIRHQQIIDGIEDVKKAAAKAGVKGAESRFIHSLAAQVSVLKVERERERKYWREENRVLEAQLRDTAEAVQAAGELILRFKDAEEAVSSAQKRAKLAEKEAETAKEEINVLKRRHQREIEMLNRHIIESKPPSGDDTSIHDHDWREVFEHKDEVLFSRGAEQASWFSGYDQCNL